MEGPIYLWIAEDGLSMPLATDMVLHEGASEPDIERPYATVRSSDV